MATMVFDTLRFTETLRAGEFTEKQAKAMVNALSSVNYDTDQLATKGDVVDLRREIMDLRREIAESKVDMIKWVIGLLLAQTGLLIAAIKWIR